MEKTVIIVAGGSGSRMNSEIPKQFLILRGKPLLLYSLEAFYNTFPDIRIIIVLPKEYFAAWNLICAQHKNTISHQLVSGGQTRFHSVKNGLKMAPQNGLIAVHDGARPLISKRLILETFEIAEKTGAAIPAIPIRESLRKITRKGNKPLDRSKYLVVQTPQVFRSEILLQAYQQNFQSDFTDDATVVEKLDVKISLLPGESTNIKITYPEDLIFAESIFSLLPRLPEHQ